MQESFHTVKRIGQQTQTNKVVTLLIGLEVV